MGSNKNGDCDCGCGNCHESTQEIVTGLRTRRDLFKMGLTGLAALSALALLPASSHAEEEDDPIGSAEPPITTERPLIKDGMIDKEGRLVVLSPCDRDYAICYQNCLLSYPGPSLPKGLCWAGCYTRLMACRAAEAARGLEEAWAEAMQWLADHRDAIMGTTIAIGIFVFVVIIVVASGGTAAPILALL